MTQEFDAELVEKSARQMALHEHNQELDVFDDEMKNDGAAYEARIYWKCKAKVALSVIAPHYEKQIAELKAQIPHKLWQFDLDTKATSVKCLLCDAEASAIVYTPCGCTCSPNIIQPRCEQHYPRALDSNEDMQILEDFRIPLKSSCPIKIIESEE